jgi:hypothetical protein
MNDLPEIYYLHYMTDNPTCIICTPRVYSHFKGQFEGLPLKANPYTPDEHLWAVNEKEMEIRVTVIAKS